MRHALHIAASVLMWLVFGYYWYVVLGRDIGAATVQAIQILALIVVGGLLVTLFWVRHNLRLARRNRRRGVPPSPQERLERDVLEREIVAPDLGVLRRARLVHVRLDDEGRKVFVLDGSRGAP
jgi:hypothetical protein